jgi:hypothetical protein
MLQLGYSLFDVQGLKCNFHLWDKANTMESMSRNKNSSVEQNIVLCGQKIAEKNPRYYHCPLKTAHTQLSSKTSSWYIAML